MKITDDYNAKQRLWAANPVVVPAPAPVRLPAFKSRRFSSHAEMNEWKAALLRQLAQSLPSHE
jgi:isopenicillin N synthase-like dioxygenase